MTRRSSCVILFAVLAVVPGATRASLAGQTGNPASKFAFTALYAPSGLTATVAGANVNLGWTAGTNGNGYSVLGVANGTNSNCSSATPAVIGSASGTTYTDTGRSTPQGTYFCYQVKTSYSSWTSVSGNPIAAAQLGVVATSVQLTNGGTASTLDTGDKIIVTFNQPITQSSGPSGTNSVCAIAGATIVVGSTTTTGSCLSTETVNLGKLTGGTASVNTRWSATYAWNASSTQLTVTIGSRTVGLSNPVVAGTWTMNPTTTSTKLLSTTGSLHTCQTNTGGGNCLPVATGAF